MRKVPLYGHYFMGIEVIYQSLHSWMAPSKRAKLQSTPLHLDTTQSWVGIQRSGILSLKTTSSSLVFVSITVNEIMDGMTFITNCQEVHFGGYGGTMYDMMLSRNLDRYQIIAFTGTESGVMHGTVFFVEGIPWGAIQPVMMLRWWLVEQN